MFRNRPRNVPKPGSGEESVWDYPRPPRIEPVADRVVVEFGGRTVAETTRALRVLETASPPTVYVPPQDVARELLQPGRGASFCEWKGRASYWDVRVGERVAENAAWGYPEPTAAYRALADYLAFYPGRVDACRLGEHRVEPQAGRFYGGWITPGILGPFKGDPGTEGW